MTLLLSAASLIVMPWCSEVALFEKTFVIFTIKSMMYLRRFRLSLQETKAYFYCVNCPGRNKMSYELARLTQDDVPVISSRDFLQFPIFGSTLTQFVLYCAIGQFRRPSCTFPRLAGHHVCNRVRDLKYVTATRLAASLSKTCKHSRKGRKF